MGDNYAPFPQGMEEYSSPMLFSVGTTKPNESGQTHVGGIYFHWDTHGGGFTNSGWHTGVKGGPMQIWGFENDNAVIAYLENPQNDGTLNAVFQKWEQWYNETGEEGMQGYKNFITAVPAGCMVD